MNLAYITLCYLLKAAHSIHPLACEGKVSMLLVFKAGACKHFSQWFMVRNIFTETFVFLSTIFVYIPYKALCFLNIFQSD